MPQFRDYVIENLNRGESYQRQIINYLLNINDFKSIDDFKEVISTMIEVDQFQKFYNDKIINHIVSAYTNNKIPEHEIEEFIKEFLLNGIRLGEKYSFYYSIYMKFKENADFVFPIREVELKEICLERLKKFVLQKDNDILKCSELYYLCRDGVDKTDHVILNKDAHSQMRTFINNFPWEYINFLIRPYGTPIYTSVNSEFTIEPFVEFTFEGWDNFWEFLNRFKSGSEYSNHKERFEKYYLFFKKFKDNNYKPVPVNVNEYGNYGIKELITENNWQVVGAMDSSEYL